MSQHNIIFEKGSYTCEATVEYTEPQGSKWNADSDRDHQGGYDIIDMLVYNEEGCTVDKHSITWDDVIRHYECVAETSELEQQLCSESDDDSWDN
ncbi:hypothetical protein S140_193 [Shewanella sp. phage 1/40]|uniref:hypothetical protein n=1 Tax=Shewanella sp. phage 1/40 TaxID=1458860 RepID=UPI0004F726C0|nr:hypothetical protein S140_193 [Shewanella sp. phage 1/40]AHK11600.1 hypothetical protein S140_193 [Shewanella sp. phage 1/40]